MISRDHASWTPSSCAGERPRVLGADGQGRLRAAEGLAADILGQHPGEVNRIFRRTKLGGIAQLGFGEIVHGAAKLNRGRDDIDTLLHAFQSYRLRTEDAAVRYRE